jgi:hypothetical protein
MATLVLGTTAPVVGSATPVAGVWPKKCLVASWMSRKMPTLWTNVLTICHHVRSAQPWSHCGMRSLQRGELRHSGRGSIRTPPAPDGCSSWRRCSGMARGLLEGRGGRAAWHCESGVRGHSDALFAAAAIAMPPRVVCARMALAWTRDDSATGRRRRALHAPFRQLVDASVWSSVRRPQHDDSTLTL